MGPKFYLTCCAKTAYCSRYRDYYGYLLLETDIRDFANSSNPLFIPKCRIMTRLESTVGRRMPMMILSPSELS
ncbi:Hypothetical protein PHPALM_18798 [Phytophthora palmivora]|uniref:Uncharacterized protein n=1 Tax=Phytophthora palmivora TaxID=4796 RepID=A0A2P4XIW0_9STRA|nr:Hypothetical protein PHPALM_18798 [Phytophthora palmivora]